MTVRFAGSRIALVSLLAVTVAASACGGDESGPAASVSTGGGASGQAAGGAAGLAGAAGAAGKSGGSAGLGGNAGGGAGLGGGSAGLGGSAGGSAGLGGNTGGGKSPGEACKSDAECTVVGIETQPPACAEAYCKAGSCAVRATDGDGDSFRKKLCKLISDGSFVIELGGDCDDTNKDVNPKGWDGPAADGQPNHCDDGIDQDCSGADGDSVTVAGASCTCVPGDVGECAQTAGGVAITFPGGKPAKGSRCQLGSRNCVNDPGGTGGQWGPCANAVGPSIEVCNNEDDDCDGATDEADAQGKTEWVYDGDDDSYRATLPVTGKPAAAFASVSACNLPNEVPKECDAALCGTTPLATCCPPNKWRPASTAKGLDCDDGDGAVHPGAAEECATGDRDKDENCNGEKNELPAVGTQLWYLDADGDGFGDGKTPPQTSCLAPGPGWKTGLVNNDCDDSRATTRPGIAEDCSTDQDDNCTGGARDGCGCLPSDPQTIACGVPSDCNYVADGSTCVNGTYEACPAPVLPVEYCPDLDGDTYCDLGSCGLYCPSVSAGSTALGKPDKFVLRGVCEAKKTDCKDDSAAISPAAAEICNGLDDNCNGTVDDAPTVGDACNVDGKASGACLGGGTLVCSGTSLVCASANAAIGKPFPTPVAYTSTAQDGWSAQAAPNGSADWDCDGEVDLWASTDNVFVKQDVRPTCGLTPSQICGTAKTYEQCTQGEYTQNLLYADAGAGVPGCSCLPNECDPAATRQFTCGGALLQFSCGWNGSTCFVLGSVGNVQVPAPNCYDCNPSSTIQLCH